ncbi:ADP/ATP-dependent (S)-NAD(P)H-hydrate dehydratase [Arthrobacter sp. KBS0703]|uniref:ADP-dependent NAD(P)H-hydrate dehydratase n=1 Tax=Arthrobacter sp. KBS0703 TaxID=1955698 RepID=UPI00163D859F|nr:ADP/ATP-dependent (S)-NAD(P)H-hydrate dehydratase [Arthrobacter sp. KBS0703]
MPVSTRAESASPGQSTPAQITPALLRGWPLPSAGADKYSRGAVLVIGGARRTPGAALLAGTAVLRAGAGRLTLAVAESVAVQLAVTLPEAGVAGLPESAGGSVGASGLKAVAEDLESADAVLIGPGLDDIDETEALLRELLRREAERDAGPRSGRGSGGGKGGHATVILDAYALGCLPQLLDELEPWAGRLILTPNPNEAGILLGRDTDNLAADVVEIAEKYRAVVSCQGVIARPPGGDAPEGADRWEITTGYGGLGTSGSGDILAGTIAGLRARGTTDAQAACWGSHLHAAAADRLASRLGSVGFLARELADELPPLMMELNT